ncbi:MAG: hypothetical protein HC894_16260 [Microcoleus sp. SM1_3_4]|nr:hypothetical protein [Microcoleus sp. SM1_3_4]
MGNRPIALEAETAFTRLRITHTVADRNKFLISIAPIFRYILQPPNLLGS